MVNVIWWSGNDQALAGPERPRLHPRLSGAAVSARLGLSKGAGA